MFSLSFSIGLNEKVKERERETSPVPTEQRTVKKTNKMNSYTKFGEKKKR